MRHPLPSEGVRGPPPPPSATFPLPEGQRDLLLVLKRSGGGTLDTVARELGVTTEAVRVRLLALQRDGWVTRRRMSPSERSERVGRPPVVYALTQAAEDLFPKAYDALTVGLVDAVARTLGDEALGRVLEDLTDARVEALRPRLEGLDLPARVRA